MNAATVQAFYKGTGMLFPIEATKEEVFRIIQLGVDKYPTDDVDFIVEQMDYYEKFIFENSKCGWVGVNSQHRIAEKLGYATPREFAIMWCVNVKYLLDRGVIKDDKNFGFMCMECLQQNPFELLKETMDMLHKSDKKCFTCGLKGKHYCANCNQAMYCSKECQRSNWKEHKKTCRK